jgi:hypothetical protein
LASGLSLLALTSCRITNQKAKSQEPGAESDHERKSNMLGAVIQRVTVFDTRRETVTHSAMRAVTSGCNKTGANTLITTVARIELTRT